MTKRRISTTISQKHWDLLNKHLEKFETQQKVIEQALESLENSSKQNSSSIWETRCWMFVKSTKSVCFVLKDGLKMLIEAADIELVKEFVTRNKPIEHSIEFYFQKPLKELSLREVIDGLVTVAITGNWFDIVDCKDESSHHTLMIIHSLGLNNSKINVIMIENLFKTYGVKAESTISEKTIFIKIFKN
ncbi:MAG: hypothetical protein QM426_05135 [Euryarchaeota archaeon]|nr:hypothetical protein [Euryarchaeota archaeon]